MKEWVEIGVYGPAEVGKKVGKKLYLRKHLVKFGKQTLLLTLPDKPATVGLDPRHLLNDWKLTENYKVVKSKN